MNVFQRIVTEPLEKFGEKVLQFLPNFLVSVVIIAVGFGAGLLSKKLSGSFFRAAGIDRFFEGTGTADVLKKSGLKEPVSLLLSKLVGGIVVVLFIYIAMLALDIPAVGHLLEGFFLYLPHVFVASLILLLGYLLGNFFGRAALIASVNAGIRIAGIIGKFVKLTVFMLAATMALEHLGIGRETVIIAFTIVFGGIVLALALAFGLGGRDMARDYLEKKFRGEEEQKDEFDHL